MKISQFIAKNASLHYDQRSGTIFVTYDGEVSANTVLRVHSWMQEIVAQFGIKKIRGTVVDFRETSKFPPNIMTAIQVSDTGGRSSYDFENLPTSMIFRNAAHHMKLNISRRSDHFSEQVEMVNDMKSATSHIAGWYQRDLAVSFAS